MDSKIWSNLPTELVERIVHESCPTIDVQLAFKIGPKKINEAKAWRLWWLLESHDGVIYNLETQSLHNFTMPGVHVVRRPIELDWYDDGLWSFNSEGREYSTEIYLSDGSVVAVPSREAWLTEMRVLLKGSGLARMLNASGSSS